MSIDAMRGAPELPGGAERHQQLRKACQNMEALFLQKLFETMRDTVPEEEGLFEKSEGEEIFTSMLDEKFAEEAATKLERGLGEAMYRQLARRLGGGGNHE
jgi:flagellar protein FlgJ